MAEGSGRGGQRLDAALHFGRIGGIDPQIGRAQAGGALQQQVDGAVGGERVIDFHGLGGIAQADLSGGPETGQHRIAGRARARDFEEGVLRLLVLALAAKLDRRLEARARLFGGEPLAVFVPAPAAGGGDDEKRPGNDPVLVAFPSLYGSIATIFLVNFADKVGHLASVGDTRGGKRARLMGARRWALARIRPESEPEG